MSESERIEEIRRLHSEWPGLAMWKHDALTDLLTALDAAQARLLAFSESYEEACSQLDNAEAEVGRLRELLIEVANSGVEFEDERVRYVSVQIDRGVWLDDLGPFRVTTHQKRRPQ